VQGRAARSRTTALPTDPVTPRRSAHAQARAYPRAASTTFAPVRRAVAFGLLALGMLVPAVSEASAQPVAPPTTVTPTVLPSSTTVSTSTRPPAAATGDRLPTLGEGFPWITVGAVILVAGLVGARLRRASRR
jgi:hypothetical protein